MTNMILDKGIIDEIVTLNLIKVYHRLRTADLIASKEEL